MMLLLSRSAEIKDLFKGFVVERISNYCLTQEYFDCFGPELIFSTNENISCHSARVTSLGNYKKARWHSFTLFYADLSSRTDLSYLSLSSLLSSWKDQLTWETTFTLLHWLFFTDSLSHISSCLLSTTRKPHPIYGPLMSGKLFFRHSSFLLNQRILGETNCILLTPVLTSAF